MALLPRTLKAGPFVYSVHTDQETYDKVCLEGMKELEASTSHVLMRIAFRPGRSASWTADSALHELLHIAFHLHGIALENVKDLPDLEEYIVSGMSPLLLMLLRDNPDYVAFIMNPEVPWDVDGSPQPPPAATHEHFGRVYPGDTCPECA